MNWPEYAQTKDADIQWLDRIPTSWTSRRLRSLYFEIDERRGDQDGLELLSVSIHRGVQLRSDLITDKEARAEDLSGYKVCRAGDIILNRMRAFQGGLGASPQDGIVSPDYMVMRPAGDVGSPFLAYLMKTNWFVEQMSSRLRGIGSTAQGNARTPRINPSDLGNIKVPLPPPDVQATIVGFLDQETQKVNALIAKQERLIATLREDRTATITHAVTKGLDGRVLMKESGLEWIGEIPAHWTATRLGRLCRSISDGPHFSPSYVDDGVMFLSARNIKVDGWSLEDAKFISEDDYKQFSRRVVPEVGDVLYTKGGTTGIARAVDFTQRFQVWVHVAVLKLRQSLVTPDYLAYALNSSACYEQSQLYTRGATNQDLGLTRMVRILLALPPLDEQREIVKFLDERCGNIDALIAKADEVIETMREYRSALITDAVTGKIDVRVAA